MKKNPSSALIKEIKKLDKTQKKVKLDGDSKKRVKTMSNSLTSVECPTCKSIKFLGEMEFHCCSTCKNWAPLANTVEYSNKGVCTQENVHNLLKNPGITPSTFGCIYHNKALFSMKK